MKSALFVDFDNVYSGLRILDQTIADRFARQPLQWMNWVINALELPDHTPEGARRRLLVRRCYLNPQAYQRFRPSFNLAGFEIVDCPALTSEGKTSTDIHMVLDIIDLLQHETHYDEFIVFSADAEFDGLIETIRQEVARSSVPVPCSRLAVLITTQCSALTADWNGKGSFRKFIESLDLAPLHFDWSTGGGHVHDSTRPVTITRNGCTTADWGSDVHILPLATQIHEVSGAPLLRPQDYRALFSIIEQDVRLHPFDLKETGKRVRDGLREGGFGGSRADVNWVLSGLLMRGHVFNEGQDDAVGLGVKTANNVRSLCLREQMVLDRAAETAIAHWFGTAQASTQARQ